MTRAPQNSRKTLSSSRLGNYLLSLVCLIIVPVMPLGVEAVKHGGVVVAENYLLTAAVLAAGYAVSTQRMLFIALYILGFILCMVADDVPVQTEAPSPASPALTQPLPPAMAQAASRVPQARSHSRRPADTSAPAAPPAAAPAAVPAAVPAAGTWQQLLHDIAAAGSAWLKRHYAGAFLIFIVSIQAVERFWTHILDDGLFPDWREN